MHLLPEHEDMSARIMEINENIHNYHENEDINLQVFSPRKIDNQNEEKIERMATDEEYRKQYEGIIEKAQTGTLFMILLHTYIS